MLAHAKLCEQTSHTTSHMVRARDWEGTIRTVVSHALFQRGCLRGWSVLNHRGHVRLNIAAGAGGGRRRQVLLPIPWECDQIDQIRDAVLQVFDEFQKGVDLDLCVAQIIRLPHAASSPGSIAEAPALLNIAGSGSKFSIAAAPLSPLNWQELISAFQEHKLISGEIKPSTWHRVYRHHMNHVLGAVSTAAPPQNAKQLLEALARIWADKPGGRPTSTPRKTEFHALLYPFWASPSPLPRCLCLWVA